MIIRSFKTKESALVPIKLKREEALMAISSQTNPQYLQAKPYLRKKQSSAPYATEVILDATAIA